MNNGQLNNGDSLNEAIESPFRDAIYSARAELDKADDDLTQALQKFAAFSELRESACNNHSPPTVVCFSDNDMCHAKLLVWLSTSLLNLEKQRHADALSFCKTMVARGIWVQCAGIFKDDAWQYDVKLAASE